MKKRTCKKCGKVDDVENYFLAEQVELKGNLCKDCEKKEWERKINREVIFEMIMAIVLSITLPFLAIYTWISLQMTKGIPYELINKVIITMHDISVSQPVIIVSFAYFVLIVIIVAIVCIIFYIFVWIMTVFFW